MPDPVGDDVHGVTGVTGVDAGQSPPGSESGGFTLPFWWDTQKLHALRPPVHTLPVDELRWHLNWKVWSNYGMPFRVSPAEVRRDPEKFSTQFERTMAADLSYPLYVVRWAGRWTILDGIHRLLKAEILGMSEVSVYVVEPDDIATIMVPPPEEAMSMLRQFFEENPESDGD